MVTMYEVISGTCAKALIALSAAEDPILMHAIRHATMNETKTERIGRFQPGGTFQS